MHQSARSLIKNYHEHLQQVKRGFAIEWIANNLKNIANGNKPVPSEKIQKLALLYGQIKKVKSSDVAALKEEYNKKIDSIATFNEIVDVLKDLEFDLGVILTTTYNFDLNREEYKFVDDLFSNLETTSASSGSLNNTLNEFIKNTHSDNKTPLCEYSLEQFSVLASAFENNLPQIKANFKNYMNPYFERISENLLSDNLETKMNEFYLNTGYAIHKLYDIDESVYNANASKLLDEYICEIRVSYKNIINNSTRLEQESKKKLCDAIDNIRMNGGHSEIFEQLDGIDRLQLGDNRLKNITQLNKAQKMAHSEFDKTKGSDHSKAKGLLWLKCKSIIDSGAHSKGSTAYVTFDEVLQWTLIANQPGVAESCGMSPNELVKWMLTSVLAHEGGHVLDSMLGTREGRAWPMPSRYCSEEEQEKMFVLKDKINSAARSKTTWAYWEENDETFADYMSYLVTHDIAAQKGCTPPKIASVARKVFPLALLAISELDPTDTHPPPYDIRFDTVVGLNNWLYSQ